MRCNFSLFFGWFPSLQEGTILILHQLRLELIINSSFSSHIVWCWRWIMIISEIKLRLLVILLFLCLFSCFCWIVMSNIHTVISSKTEAPKSLENSRFLSQSQMNKCNLFRKFRSSANINEGVYANVIDILLNFITVKFLKAFPFPYLQLLQI